MRAALVAAALTLVAGCAGLTSLPAVPSPTVSPPDVSPESQASAGSATPLILVTQAPTPDVTPSRSPPPMTVDASASRAPSADIDSHAGDAPDLAGQLERLIRFPPPARDLVAIRTSFGVVKSGPIPPTPAAGPRSFWVHSLVGAGATAVQAHLVYRNAAFDLWSDDPDSVDRDRVSSQLTRFRESSLTALSDRLDPQRRAPFAPVTILSTRLGSATGYYSSVNEFSPVVARSSNHLPMVVIDRRVTPGTTAFDAVLAHELAHLLQWRLDSSEETWVNEGTAEVAVAIAGISTRGSADQYVQRSAIQLNHWAATPGSAGAHYSGAFLFFSYLAHRFGGHEVLGDLLASPLRGMTAIDALAGRRGLDGGAERLALDWVAATSGISSVTRYPGLAAGGLPAVKMPDSPTLATQRQFSPRIYRIGADSEGRTARVTFDPLVRLTGAPARDGPFWWSSRGDSIASDLRRRVDLRGVTAATLRFGTWYDLEPDYDYGYVAVSRDGGASWRTLPWSSTTRADPNHANLGDGLTGVTSEWRDASVDLGPFVGAEIDLRFLMVTDDAYNAGGWAIADIAIPEIGWTDHSAETEWRPGGFQRIVDAAPQRVRAGFVTADRGAPGLEELTSIGPGVLEGRVPTTERLGSILLAIVPVSPITLQAAEIRVELMP